MTHSTENRGPAHGPLGHFRFSEFDSLPRPLRDLLNYAPLSFSSDVIWEAYTMWGWNVDTIIREFRIALPSVVTTQRLSTWGKEYPCHSSYLIESAFKDIPKSPTSGAQHAPAAGARTPGRRPMRASRAHRTWTKKNHSPST
jgi:hypothetical protein